MILRRVIAHFRKQEWTAIAIDFVIVVVGVFIGIQVANWNARLNDGQRAENYRARLTQEMTINRRSLVGRQESYARQIEYGLFAVDAAAPADREAAWVIIRAFFQASHVFTITLQRGTYDEIINAGDLALLNDQKLVNALSGLYTFSGFSSINIIPDYRENVRRIIPFPMQRYFQTQCYEVAALDIHLLLDCPAPDEFDDLIELAAELRANDELMRDLRYMLSYAGVSASIAGNLNDKVDEILTIVAPDAGLK